VSPIGEIEDGRFPDIEIYIQRVEVSALIDWLSTLMGVTDVQQKGKSTVLTLEGSPTAGTDINDADNKKPMICTIVPDAVKGKYTSVWITPNETDWMTDHQFARTAFEHFQLETRCSTGSWDGNDEEGWIRITPDGESIVNWLVD